MKEISVIEQIKEDLTLLRIKQADVWEHLASLHEGMAKLTGRLEEFENMFEQAQDMLQKGQLEVIDNRTDMDIDPEE
jgi:predicted nuclease with TOPRIM domain